VIQFFNDLGLPIEHGRDDIELIVIEWLVVPENNHLFFEEIYKQIDGFEDSSVKEAFLK
jgi:hypothetical protein